MDQEVETDSDESKKKDFDVDRVVNECLFDQDTLDRRIVFEMIGERLHPDDFPDETSESDNEGKEGAHYLPDIDPLYNEALLINESRSQVTPDILQ